MGASGGNNGRQHRCIPLFMLKLREKKILSSHSSSRSFFNKWLQDYPDTSSDRQQSISLDIQSKNSKRLLIFRQRVEILMFCTELAKDRHNGQHWQRNSYLQSCQTRQNTFEYQRRRQIMTHFDQETTLKGAQQVLLYHNLFPVAHLPTKNIPKRSQWMHIYPK